MSMVEWKNIENCIVSLKTGLNPRQNFKLNLAGNSLPYITGKDIYANKINISPNTDKIDSNAVSLINKRACLESNILLFASTGTGTVGRMAIIEDYNNDWAISETLYAIKTSVEIKPQFLMHVLYSDVAKKQFEPKISKGSVPHLKIADLMKVSIPVPTLSEQTRIVGILDTFTASIDNLKEQIAQRRKQYEYYRDQLLDLEGKEGVEMKKLSCIAEIGTGSSNTQDELEKGKYPFFVRSQIVRWKNEYEFDETAIITSGDGVGVGKVLHYYEGKYALHQRAYRIHVLVDDFVPKFLFYFMQKDFYNYIMLNAYAASVTSVRKPMLLNYPIPVPSLQEQQRIVSILDTFEASIQNLEAQLSQREKQYDYYRNKLLTFE